VSEPPERDDAGLRPEDVELIRTIASGNDWLRSMLCTLARRGTRLRHDAPERADELLSSLSRWPWFKGGQFLFDLLEWEDFMVDGTPPPLLPGVLSAQSWQRIAETLHDAQALLDGAASRPVDGSAVPGWLDSEPVDDAGLPALEPGLHLYRDVVLGVAASSAPILRAISTARPTPTPPPGPPTPPAPPAPPSGPQAPGIPG